MKFKFNLLALLALSLIGINSCMEKPLDPVDERPMSITLEDINAADAFVFTECNLEKEMVLYPFAPDNNQALGGDTRNTTDRKTTDRKLTDRNTTDARMGMMSLERIFKELKLNDRQASKVRELNQQQIKCLERVRLAMHQALQPIIERSNLKRAEIIKALRAGRITREEAALELRKLNQSTREAIANSEAVKNAQANMINCRKMFLDGVRAILTAEQQAIWDKYMGKMRG